MKNDSHDENNNTIKTEVSNEVTTADLKSAIDLAAKGFEATSSAVLGGAKLLNEASERFSEKSPGQRSSWLGYILVIGAILAKVTHGIPKLGFEFSDTFSLGMLVIGGILVVAGGAFDTYFTIKIANAQESRAAALENTANEALEEAKQARTESLSMYKRIVGKFG